MDGPELHNEQVKCCPSHASICSATFIIIAILSFFEWLEPVRPLLSGLACVALMARERLSENKDMEHMRSPLWRRASVIFVSIIFIATQCVYAFPITIQALLGIAIGLVSYVVTPSSCLWNICGTRTSCITAYRSYGCCGVGSLVLWYPFAILATGILSLLALWHCGKIKHDEALIGAGEVIAYMSFCRDALAPTIKLVWRRFVLTVTFLLVFVLLIFQLMPVRVPYFPPYVCEISLSLLPVVIPLKCMETSQVGPAPQLLAGDLGRPAGDHAGGDVHIEVAPEPLRRVPTRADAI